MRVPVDTRVVADIRRSRTWRQQLVGLLDLWPQLGDQPGARREDAFNLGIYRMQVTGRDTTLMRWLKHRGGAQHHQRWRAARAEPLPAAAVVGADPGTILAAGNSLRGGALEETWKAALEKKGKKPE